MHLCMIIYIIKARIGGNLERIPDGKRKEKEDSLSQPSGSSLCKSVQAMGSLSQRREQFWDFSKESSSTRNDWFRMYIL